MKPWLGTLNRIYRICRICRNQPEVVAPSVPWTLPSTRAGGQDDMSSEQTLSNYVSMFVFQQDVMHSACLGIGLQQLV